MWKFEKLNIYIILFLHLSHNDKSAGEAAAPFVSTLFSFLAMKKKASLYGQGQALSLQRHGLLVITISERFWVTYRT
jgi:hypothetical protein